LCQISGIGLADVVAEKQEPAAVTLDGGSTEQLSKRLSALEEQATATLRDQVQG
jgi:N-methylhydantoinase A/oxoprolinase/acetone carboxylase beta subunit